MGHCFVHSLIIQGIHRAVRKDVAVVEGGGGEVVPIGVPQIAGPNLYPLVVPLSDRHGTHQLVPRKTKLILVPVHNLVLKYQYMDVQTFFCFCYMKEGNSLTDKPFTDGKTTNFELHVLCSKYVGIILSIKEFITEANASA